MRTFILFLLAAFVAMPGTAHAEAAGKIASVSGYVRIESKGAIRMAALQAPVEVGDIVRTGANGRIGIVFVDDSAITVSRNSEIEITSYLYQANTSRLSKLKLWAGRMRAVVSKYAKGDNKFEISTPTAVAGVRGTDLVVTLEPANSAALPAQSARENPAAFQTSVAVIKGVVAVTSLSGEGEVVLGQGQSSVVSFDAKPGQPRDMSPEEISQIETASKEKSGGTQLTGGPAAADANAFLQEQGAGANSGSDVLGAMEPVAGTPNGTPGAQNGTPPINQQPGSDPSRSQVVVPQDTSNSVPVNVEMRRAK